MSTETKEKEEQIKVVNYIHEDLVVNILSKLPVKSLTRFKCVSKSWYNLIRSSNFLDIHLKSNGKKKGYIAHIVEDDNTRKFFIMFIPYGDNLEFFTYDLCKTGRYFYVSEYPSLIGSCNGLLCLELFQELDESIRPRYMVLNPATRESKEVKAPNFYCKAIWNCFGFGFDPKAKDYKLVSTSFVLDNSNLFGGEFKTEVFALKENKWRLVDRRRMEGSTHEFYSTTFVHNTVHWMGTRDDMPSIFAFDIVEEVFRYYDFTLQHQFCDCYETNHLRDHRCCVVKGMLGVVTLCREGVSEVWTMQQYGVETSWTKLYTYDLFSPNVRELGPILLVGLGANGELVVSAWNNHLVVLTGASCGGGKKSITIKRNIYLDSTPINIINYRESLVLIDHHLKIDED